MNSETPKLSDAMTLAWVIECTRCKAEQHVTFPDDMAWCALVLSEDGWTISMKPSANKKLLAGVMDTSAWPDERMYVLCPECGKETNRG